MAKIEEYNKIEEKASNLAELWEKATQVHPKSQGYWAKVLLYSQKKKVTRPPCEHLH